MAERSTSRRNEAKVSRRADGQRSQPRLLFVSAGLSPRGGGIAAAGRLLLDATRDWATSRGVELRLLTLGDRDDVPAGVAGTAFAGRRGALARAVWRAQFLEGYRHHVYDFLGVARIQGVLPQRLRARYLTYLYGIECWRPLRGSRRRALAGATARLACSDHTVARMRQSNPDAPEVVPLHLALGEAPAGGAGDPAVLAGIGERAVLIVGRLAEGERYKGHEALIAAIARLASLRLAAAGDGERAGAAVQLVVVGEGEDRERLAAHAAALRVADRVRFTGFVDPPTLEALYRRCAVFAMPSDGEGFGFVYLEAMRAGKPCVALRGSAAAEIVVDGETGRLIERDIEPLAAALAELIEDPARAAALGAAGRERWQREFRPAAFGARFCAQLDGLVGVSGAAVAAAAPRGEMAVSLASPAAGER